MPVIPALKVRQEDQKFWSFLVYRASETSLRNKRVVLTDTKMTITWLQPRLTDALLRNGQSEQSSKQA